MTKIKLSDGTNIWYKILGDGPLLVLNYGYGSSHKNFKHFINDLTDNFTCLIWDQRGHGLSDTPIGNTYEETKMMYSISQLADDCFELLGILNYINNFEKIFIFGVSMGGMVSQEYVIKYGETLKALGLAATTSKMRHPLSSILKCGTIPLAKNGEKLETELGYTKKFLKKYPEYSHIQINENFFILEDKLIIMPENLFGNFNVEKQISKITIPIIILHGEDDEIMDVKEGRRMNELIPNSELFIFPHVKHDIAKQVSESIARNIKTFFLRNI